MEKKPKSIKPAAATKKRSTKPAAKGVDLPTIPESGSSEYPHETVEGTRERIATKAYELFVARGCGHGQALEDWLEAERMVLKEIKR